MGEHKGSVSFPCSRPLVADRCCYWYMLICIPIPIPYRVVELLYDAFILPRQLSSRVLWMLLDAGLDRRWTRCQLDVLRARRYVRCSGRSARCGLRRSQSGQRPTYRRAASCEGGRVLRCCGETARLRNYVLREGPGLQRPWFQVSTCCNRAYDGVVKRTRSPTEVVRTLPRRSDVSDSSSDGHLEAKVGSERDSLPSTEIYRNTPR
ncbi:hypothetical protein L227DRAFT_212126 [Lentinus tigrinus ALCF2SS1-6]|uniref:Uncharacterized protein n=1 Tax=Lentinus tigrinus ALCF2SS1-6 TaxID=1328759 RepID=A0A5C2SWF3_9APHY|nr:hypothetical protein L227DRAFT_212126 [Lentinus tigrinus ALCF2SS1-6]